MKHPASLLQWKMRSTEIRSWWAQHQTTVLRLVVALMAVLGLLRLGYEFNRLLWVATVDGAVDLKLRHRSVQSWFAGQPVYEAWTTAIYPPATYAILWPFLGWLEITQARWLWAATSVVALLWLTRLTVRESGAHLPLERAFVAWIPIAMYATGVTIGNGQLAIHILAATLSALFLLREPSRSWGTDLLAAALLLFSLVKPSLSLPFLWLVLISPQPWRPLILTSLGYGGLTLFCSTFQSSSLPMLLRSWLARGATVAAVTGYGHLPLWLASLGLADWTVLAMLVVLLTLGLWTWRHRHHDVWLLLGVAGIVARLWTYHHLYDDLLILLPMVTLFRMTRRGTHADGGGVIAGILFGMSTAAALAPARLLRLQPPWPWVFKAGQTVVWIAMLVFLLHQGRIESQGEP